MERERTGSLSCFVVPYSIGQDKSPQKSRFLSKYEIGNLNTAMSPSTGLVVLLQIFLCTSWADKISRVWLNRVFMEYHISWVQFRRNGFYQRPLVLETVFLYILNVRLLSTGVIPVEMGKLTNLHVLNLGVNQLSGEESLRDYIVQKHYCTRSKKIGHVEPTLIGRLCLL